MAHIGGQTWTGASPGRLELSWQPHIPKCPGKEAPPETASLGRATVCSAEGRGGALHSGGDTFGEVYQRAHLGPREGPRQCWRTEPPDVTRKQANYAWCRPAGSGSRSGGGSGGGGEEASSGLDWGVGLSALVSLVVGHKPRVVMFGPGLDSRTSKLVRSILSDPGHGGNQLSRFKVTGMVPGEFAGMGSGISLRFAEHNFNLVTLHSNTRRVRQGEGHQRVQDNKLFTQAGEAFQLAPAVIELCRRSQAFVFVVDATKGPAQIAQSADELSAVCCNLWSSSHAPLLVLACSRGTWSPRYEDAEPLSPSEVGRALRLGRLSNRRWLVQAGEVETLHGVRSGFQWLLSGINPVLSLAQPR